MYLWHLKKIRLVLFSVGCYLSVFLIFRSLFFIYFNDYYANLNSGTIIKALYLGLKFDFRLALIICIPILLFSFFPKYNIASNSIIRNLGKAYTILVMALLLFFYICDFIYFAYLGERVNVSALNFLKNPYISGQMVWESYPVVWLLLGFGIVLLFFIKLFKRLYLMLSAKQDSIISKKQYLLAFVLIFLFFALGIFGKVNTLTPLRWSEAYFANNSYVAALGLNPVLFFFDTFKNRKQIYDLNLVKKYYNTVSKYLNVDTPNTNDLNFIRRKEPLFKPAKPVNVVLIMLESLGANRVGILGNKLNPTPHIDAIAKKGWFFPNFYVPASGTSRTVFGKITGIPDVSMVETATRNPLIINQHTIINHFKKHDKYYFLGGSANWANMRGLLTNNIKGLLLFEEGDYKYPRVDVWGISDRDLFKAAHNTFCKQNKDKPFFAIIQTAANHRPFTIPKDDSNFKVKNISEKKVSSHGFLNARQYNAIRLMDFNVGEYLKIAQKAPYFDNTLFLLYGDHNDKSKLSPHMPVDDLLGLTKHHVPFIMYGPEIIKNPEIIKRVTTLMDMLPTAASMAGISYINTTMGRDINRSSTDNYALIFGGDRHNRPLIGVVGDKFYLSMYFDGTNICLHKLKSERPENDVKAFYPEKTKQMTDITRGFFETARYMFYHNEFSF